MELKAKLAYYELEKATVEVKGGQLDYELFDAERPNDVVTKAKIVQIRENSKNLAETKNNSQESGNDAAASAPTQLSNKQISVVHKVPESDAPQ